MLVAMKKIALLAAGAVAVGGGAVAVTANAASSTTAVRAVQTAGRGISVKPHELDRERTHWEVTFADGTERLVTLDGRRVTSTRRGAWPARASRWCAPCASPPGARTGG